MFHCLIVFLIMYTRRTRWQVKLLANTLLLWQHRRHTVPPQLHTQHLQHMPQHHRRTKLIQLLAMHHIPLLLRTQLRLLSSHTPTRHVLLQVTRHSHMDNRTRRSRTDNRTHRSHMGSNRTRHSHMGNPTHHLQQHNPLIHLVRS